jgi:propanol-preferring alcohol dehydrogenase
MKAMVMHEFGAPMELEELPTPVPGPGEVLVRVRACGLCGTDVKVADGDVASVKLPLVPGHELAGEVVELGPGAQGFAVGDHVVVHIYITCGRCWFCRNALENNCRNTSRLGFERNGGFGEYVTAPDRNCYWVAKHVPFEAASILSGSIATPFHGLRCQGKVTVGDTVVLFGVGGLGLHAVQLARVLGARVIAVDIDDEKLELARSLGAVETINSRQTPVAARVRELTDGLGASVVVPVVGGKALPAILGDAFASLRPSGKMVLLGYLPGVKVEVDSNDLVYNAWEILGSRSSTTQDLIDVIQLVESGQVKPIVARTYPVESANDALDIIRVGGPAGRMVLMV